MKVKDYDDVCIKRYIDDHKLRAHNSDSTLSIEEVKTMMRQGKTFKIQNIAKYSENMIGKVYHF
jgi:polyhydroxyalkanoate synthesis regulator protein